MDQVPSIKQQILCIATRTPGIGIDDELNAIQTIMAGRHSGFDVEIQYVTKVEQVSEAIQNRKNRPQIIHISGDGTTDGKINIPDQENGKVDELKPEDLAEFFKNAGDVNYVILNFCYSEQAAKLIAQSIQCVIGINNYIKRTAAVEFSQNFYRSLEGNPLDQDSVDAAFSKGQAAAFPRTGDIDRYIKLTRNPEMQLIEPAEGSNIPKNCKFSGTFKNLSEGASMWAYVNATLERKFYLVPIEDYHSDGTWQKVVITGQDNDTNIYRVGVLIADAEVTKTLNEDFSKLGILRFDTLPNGAKKFGDRAVTRQ